MSHKTAISLSHSRDGQFVSRVFCFSIFLLFGFGIVYMFLIAPIWFVFQTRNWLEIPCTIISAEVENHEDDDNLQIVYQYEIAGRVHQCDQYYLIENLPFSYGRKKRVVDRYPPGRRTRCYVDPQDSTRAVLNRGLVPEMLLGALGLPPLLVGAIGWIQIFSRKTHPWLQRMAVVGFVSTYVLMCLGVAYVFTIGPIWLVVRARNWVEVPCTVVSSEIKDNGENFRAHVVYKYEFAGRLHQCSRYHFVCGYSSDYAGHKRIVDDHPPGLQTDCYIDPHDPTHAVIYRGFVFPDMLAGLFPLLFALFLLIGIGCVAWQSKTKSE